MYHATGVASKSLESLSSVTKFPAFYGPHSQYPAKKYSTLSQITPLSNLSNYFSDLSR